MTRPLTRRQLLKRAAAGASALTVPGLLAGIDAPAALAAGKPYAGQTLKFSNWPLYIDVDEKTKKRPTLDQFTRQTGIKVAYTEDINDNGSFFGKIQGPLSRRQGVGRDIIVMTDSSGYPARLVSLGWLEKIDKKLAPNAKNLLPSQQHPSWDPKREYSLPWQSGMTGIGYDPKKTGGPVTSIGRLLDDKKLKGKVTFLTEMSDTIGLVLLDMGEDPAHVSKKSFDAAIKRLQKAVDSGQIRQFTGNDYAPLLAKGDVWACVAWSGDMIQLQADHPGLRWVQPTKGAMIWTDNMLIPKGGNVALASTWMNFYYQPKVAAAVEDYVNYICPVVGADKQLRKTDPGVAKNPLIFPTQKMLKNAHQFDAKASNNAAFKTAFQKLIGA